MVARVLLALLPLLPSVQESTGSQEPVPSQGRPEGTLARPNVLLLGVDDLRPALGAFGDGFARTPCVDRLAARGVAFRRAYCQVALCTPSRESFLTGLRPETTGVYGLRDRARGDRGRARLPGWFAEHGYHVVGLGKVHHAGRNATESWSEAWWGPEDDGEVRYALPANVARASEGDPPAVERADVPDDAYPDGRIAARAVDLLGRLGSERPFLLAVGFQKPHLPFAAPARYWDLYERAEVPLAASDRLLTGERPRASDENSAELRGYAGFPGRGPIDPERARELVHGYYACVSYVDAQIGLVLEALEGAGLAESTLVVLWSDHGFALGETGLWGKKTNGEAATRTPLLVAAPGRAGNGRTSNALVELVDVLPTLCDLAGLPRPEALEGLSLVPLLDDPERAWKSAVFSDYVRRGQGFRGRAIRTDRYRLIVWQPLPTAGGGPVRPVRGSGPAHYELYDLAEDPEEAHNLAAERGRESLLAELERRLEQGWQGALPPR